MNEKELIMLQSLPLEIKIEKTKLRIQEFVNYFGIDGVYLSFSGGKDSSVLAHIIQEMYGAKIPFLFANTGLEFPELVDHVKYIEISYENFLENINNYNIDKLKKINKTKNLHSLDVIKMDRPNLVIVKPKKTFIQVLKEDGYPILSKVNAFRINQVKTPTKKNSHTRKIRLNNYVLNKDGTFSKTRNAVMIPKKWRYLIEAPFKISSKCCDNFKKKPFKEYEKETGRKPIIGILAEESQSRKKSYLKTGCNSFDKMKSTCTPIAFWREQDILEYILKFNVKIPSVYGEIKRDNKTKFLYTTGESRTGCVFCMFGMHLEKGENRFQRLERTHPKLHNYCMEQLGFKDVCDYMHLPYSNKINERKSDIWVEGEKKQKEWELNEKEKYEYFTREIK